MIYNKRSVEPTQNFGANKSTIEKARALRKKMTKAEKFLWFHLRKRKLLGKHFRNQHPLSFYIVDFYCHECGLIIEVDGEIHKFQKADDFERTKTLESFGLKVIRFSNEEVLTNIDYVIEKIIKLLQ